MKTKYNQFKFLITYHRDVDDIVIHTKRIQTINISTAMQMFHDTTRKIFPKYFISNIAIEAVTGNRLEILPEIKEFIAKIYSDADKIINDNLQQVEEALEQLNEVKTDEQVQ